MFFFLMKKYDKSAKFQFLKKIITFLSESDCSLFFELQENVHNVIMLLDSELRKRRRMGTRKQRSKYNFCKYKKNTLDDSAKKKK